MAEYDYVRHAYGVDPRPGQRVWHTEIDRFGVVAPERPSQGHYVMVFLDGETHPSPCHPTALDYDASDRHLAPMWVIYDHPRDHPRDFVARRWVSLPSPRFTHDVRVAPTLDELRDLIQVEYMHRLERSPLDEPQIVEVWLV